jgi:hypothetical protein
MFRFFAPLVIAYERADHVKTGNILDDLDYKYQMKNDSALDWDY